MFEVLSIHIIVVVVIAIVSNPEVLSVKMVIALRALVIDQHIIGPLHRCWVLAGATCVIIFQLKHQLSIPLRIAFSDE